jgi:hypothetical protein
MVMKISMNEYGGRPEFDADYTALEGAKSVPSGRANGSAHPGAFGEKIDV